MIFLIRGAGVARLVPPSILILRICARWTSEKPPADRSELRNTIHVLPLLVPLSGAHATPPAASPTPADDDAGTGTDGGAEAAAGVAIHSSTGTASRTGRGTPPLALGCDSTTYYGTRLSTVILIRRDGNATFIERDIWALEQQQGGEQQQQQQRASDAEATSENTLSASGADGGGEVPAHPKPKPIPEREHEPKAVDKRDSGGRDHDRVFHFQIPIPSAR